MILKKVRAIAILSIIVTLPIIAEEVKFKSSVSLSVSAPESVKNQIQSYLGREFRGLGDVDVAYNENNNYGLVVSIVTLELVTTGGIKTGYAITIVIYYRHNPSFFDTYLLENKKEEAQKYLTDWCSSPEVWLRSGGLNDLQAMCSEIVADIDTKYIQPERDLWSKYIVGK